MIVLQPIGIVRNSRHVVEDDRWGGIVSDIEVTEPFGPEGLTGIEEFSHAEVIFYFHRVEEDKIVTGARHPRNQGGQRQRQQTDENSGNARRSGKSLGERAFSVHARETVQRRCQGGDSLWVPGIDAELAASESQNGVTIQVYVAIIASLLLSLWVGKKPTKRTYEMFCLFFMGWATEEELAAHLESLKDQDDNSS